MRKTLLVLMLTWLAAVAPIGAAPKLPDPDHSLSDPAVESVAGFIFSKEYEQKFISKNDKILPPDAPETLYVRRVTDRLVRVVRNDRPDLVFEVKVVKGDDVNALCIPGGHVYVYTGLLDFLHNKFPAADGEDLLAAALGHEMAHAVLRHSLETWARSDEFEKVLTDKAVYKKLLMTMSRDMELEADRYGALYMLRAGYRVSAGADLFSKLPSSHSPNASHPPGEERVAQWRKYVGQLRDIVDLWGQGLTAARAQNFAEARICFTALRSEFPQLPSVHNNLGWTLYGLYQESLPAEKRSAQQITFTYIPTLGITVRGGVRGDTALLRESREAFDNALRLNPSEVSAYEGRAACALEEGDARLAAELLDKASRVTSREAALANLWGVVHERQGDVGAATTAYELAAHLDAHYLPAMYNLACLYQKQGKKAQAQALLTRYAAVDADGYWADQARAHLQALGVRLPAKKPAAAEVKVAGIALGSTEQDVRKQLGAPDEQRALKSGTRIFHYKVGIDVYLSARGVVGIGIRSAKQGPVLGLAIGMSDKDVLDRMGAPPSREDGEDGLTMWIWPSRGLIVGIREGVIRVIAVAG